MTTDHPFRGVRIEHLSKKKLQLHPQYNVLGDFKELEQTIDGLNASQNAIRLMMSAFSLIGNKNTLTRNLHEELPLKEIILKNPELHCCIDNLRNPLKKQKLYHDGQDDLNRLVHIPEEVSSAFDFQGPITPSNFAKAIIRHGVKTGQKPVEELGQYFDYKYIKRQSAVHTWSYLDNSNGIISHKQGKKLNQIEFIEAVSGMTPKRPEINKSPYMTPQLNFGDWKK